MNRISGKACGSAALLCAVLLAFPIKASAYNVPETVRVGLEAVCKNASSASIGTGELLIGTERDGRFEEGGAQFPAGLRQDRRQAIILRWMTKWTAMTRWI